ncbi:MAG TPA: presqualene diphosphate synthase HpnD [Castellaniella sp.]|uniref:presqualene diphosphate synthase HpnD n=1 Tax=Castellaniella sp. TaxID=1955812 RepID=UPI002EE4F7F9
MTPDEYCKNKAAQSGTSFHYAFLFLPPAQRRAMTALQAFCREVEDIVEQTTEASVARMKLAWWRSQVELMFGGKPDHPVAIALTPHIAACALTADPFYAVIEASERNLDQFRYPDRAALQQYCWLASGRISGLTAGILGEPSPSAMKFAEALGIALQMSTILADVGEDARRGRIYLPADAMDRHSVTVNEVLDGHYSAQFQALMGEELKDTRALYRDAMQLLDEADRRAQRPNLILAAIHWTLLGELERDGWHVLDQRIALTPIRKFWLAWRTWVNGGRHIARQLATHP